MMDEQLKSNLTSSKHWIRLLFMILFALVLQVASIVVTVVVAVQFLFLLITGKDNMQLRKFGDSLSIYIFEALQFLVFKSEEKPFPFADWPESTVHDDQEEGVQDSVVSSAPKKAAPKRKAAAKRKTEQADAGSEPVANETENTPDNRSAPDDVDDTTKPSES